jgi:hypothetical protein
MGYKTRRDETRAHGAEIECSSERVGPREGQIDWGKERPREYGEAGKAGDMYHIAVEDASRTMGRLMEAMWRRGEWTAGRAGETDGGEGQRASSEHAAHTPSSVEARRR